MKKKQNELADGWKVMITFSFITSIISFLMIFGKVFGKYLI